jgi:hypothetical protein
MGNKANKNQPSVSEVPAAPEVPLSQTAHELCLKIFNEIDTNHNGTIDK